jgi:hypothetical protein
MRTTIRIDDAILREARRIAEDVRTAPSVVRVAEGDRHWELFRELCRKARASRSSEQHPAKPTNPARAAAVTAPAVPQTGRALKERIIKSKHWAN